MIIREATLADVDALGNLALHFLAGTQYGRTLQTADSEHLAALITVLIAGIDPTTDDRQGVICVADLQFTSYVGDGMLSRELPHTSKLVGFLAISNALDVFTGQRYGDEVAWWVEPEHRETGAGRKLLGVGEDWARRNGLSVLKMVAPAGSQLGTLYERLGFTEVETAYSKRLIVE